MLLAHFNAGLKFVIRSKTKAFETLNARASAQKQTSGQFEVSHNFRLRIAWPPAFVHRAVDDASLHYKAVH